MLATAAAIIASQALISGAFSLTTQAIQLGCLPRFRVRYTSEHSVGQVYVPSVNWMLAAACILLVVSFKTSAALAGAYGIAIALTMAITSILFFSAARAAWGWSLPKAAIVTGLFLTLDGAFLAANSLKIIHGGWFPLVIGGAVMSLMLIWIWGRERLYARISQDALPVDCLVAGSQERPHPPGFGHGDLHERQGNPGAHRPASQSEAQPGAPRTGDPAACDDARPAAWPDTDEMLEHQELGEGLHRVTLKFGFAETPDVPAALKTRLPEDIRFQPGKATYFLGSETYGVGKKATFIDRIRLSLFAVMARNASPATAYFQLPPGRVVELGAQITL